MPNSGDESTIKRLDIRVSNDSNESLYAGAAAVIDMIKNWKSEEIEFEIFTNGITNHLLKCSVRDSPEQALLIRVYGEKTELFIDRDNEVRNMQWMCAAGLCAPLHCAFANGLCYGYSPGDVLDIKMVREPSISRLIVGRMAKMHSINSSNLEEQQSCLFPVFTKYLQLLPDDNAEIEWSRSVLKREVELLKEHLTSLQSPVVFCHNDLLLQNIIYDREKEEVNFIDFEYGDYNFQAYDIGNHFCEFSGVDKYDSSLYPDESFQMRWLKEYLEAWYSENNWDVDKISHDTVRKLYVQVNKFALAAHLTWGLWAVIQSEHSTLDFEFREYAKLKIGAYFSKRDEYLSLEE